MVSGVAMAEGVAGVALDSRVAANGVALGLAGLWLVRAEGVAVGWLAWGARSRSSLKCSTGRSKYCSEAFSAGRSEPDSEAAGRSAQAGAIPRLRPTLKRPPGKPFNLRTDANLLLFAG